MYVPLKPSNMMFYIVLDHIILVALNVYNDNIVTTASTLLYGVRTTVAYIIFFCANTWQLN